jgi:hypothetical protein
MTLLENLSTYEEYMAKALSVPWVISGNTGVRTNADTWADDDTVYVTLADIAALQEAIEGISTDVLTWEDTIDGVGESEEEEKYTPAVIPLPTTIATDVDTTGGSGGSNKDDDDNNYAVTLPESVTSGMSDLKKRFPFCIPFDIYDLVTTLQSSDSSPPVLEFTIKVPVINYNWKISIDFSMFQTQVTLFRGGLLLFFIIGLAFSTGKLIGWQLDS